MQEMIHTYKVKPWVYVAGAYSGSTYEAIDTNIGLARIRARQLWEAGFAVYCPHLNTQHFEVDCKATYEDYMSADFSFIAICQAVVLVIGWEKSEGAQAEVALAKEMGIPVYLPDQMPEISPTITKYPEQCRTFWQVIGKMYRVHLSKNEDYCVDPDTLVLTKTFEWVKISSLVPGDKLIGFTEQAAGWATKRKFEETVVESISRIKLPSYLLTLEDDTKLISSSKHPWLVMHGNTARWCDTDKLQEMDRYPKPSRLVRLFNVWGFDNSRDAGYLAAALDGEGWLTHKESTRNSRSGHDNWVFMLGFSQRNNEMLAEVERILKLKKIVYRRRFSGSTEQLTWAKRNQIIELIGSIRPPRLLPHMLPTLGRIWHYPVSLKHKEFIGDVELISIKTTTKTYIANGFASHNSPANVAGPGMIGIATRMWDKAVRLLNLSGVDVIVEKSELHLLVLMIIGVLDICRRFGLYIHVALKYVGIRKQPKHEPLVDGFIDLAVYCVIGFLNFLGVWGK
jgi:hypothetical protein